MFNDELIGFGGNVPQPGYPAFVVVYSVYRVTIDKPRDVAFTRVCRERYETVDHHMITVGQPKAYRAHLEIRAAPVLVLNCTHQRGDTLAVFATGYVSTQHGVSRVRTTAAKLFTVRISIIDVLFTQTTGGCSRHHFV